MKIVKNFNGNQEAPTGTVSFLSWENPAFREAMEQAFNVSPREIISQVVIERDGIKAVFESKNSVSQ